MRAESTEHLELESIDQFLENIERDFGELEEALDNSRESLQRQQEEIDRQRELIARLLKSPSSAAAGSADEKLDPNEDARPTARSMIEFFVPPHRREANRTEADGNDCSEAGCSAEMQTQAGLTDIPAPRHSRNMATARTRLNSLRELANHSARLAILENVRKKHRRQVFVKVVLIAQSFITAWIMLSSSLASSGGYRLFGQGAALIGVVALIEFIGSCYAVYLKE